MKKLLILILLITCLLTVGITPTFCNINLANAEEPRELDSQVIEGSFETNTTIISAFNDKYRISGGFQMNVYRQKLKSIGYYSIKIENINYDNVLINVNSKQTSYEPTNSMLQEYAVYLNPPKYNSSNIYQTSDTAVFYNNIENTEVIIKVHPSIYLEIGQHSLPKEMAISMSGSFTIKITELNEKETATTEELFTKLKRPLKTTYISLIPEPETPPTPPAPPDTRTENEKRWDNLELMFKKYPTISGTIITVVVLFIIGGCIALWAVVTRTKTNYRIAKNTFNAFKNRKTNRRKRR